MKELLPELGSDIQWNNERWRLEDIELCNPIGVNLSFKEGGRIHFHLRSKNGSARIPAVNCEIIKS